MKNKSSWLTLLRKKNHLSRERLKMLRLNRTSFKILFKKERLRSQNLLRRLNVLMMTIKNLALSAKVLTVTSLTLINNLRHRSKRITNSRDNLSN